MEKRMDIDVDIVEGIENMDESSERMEVNDP